MPRLIRRYTREAGVRNLERELANAGAQGGEGAELSKKTSVTIDERTTRASSSACRNIRYGETESEDQVGVVTGLAWTEVGGEMLTIEGVDDAGQGPHDRHRQPARRDEGVDLGGGVLCPLPRDAFGIEPTLFDKTRHPRARARGRDAQGRPVGRRGDGDGDRLGADRHPGARATSP